MADARETTGFEWGERREAAGVPYRALGEGAVPVVLVHGLGVTSRVFAPLAHAFAHRGVHVLSPDVVRGGGPNPADQSRALAAWAETLAVKNAIWVAHSAGCLALAHLATDRVDLVAEAFYVGPPWGRRTFAQQSAAFLKMLARLPGDYLRLMGTEYRRSGTASFLGHSWNASRASQHPPTELRGTVVVGERDAIVDRAWIATLPLPSVIWTPGDHGNIAGQAEEIADIVEHVRRAT